MVVRCVISMFTRMVINVVRCDSRHIWFNHIE